ncbi:MAG: 2,3-bisphosphoglycerate-independent phosphoglycerate mutase [Patescibacteria group bacterium]
MTYKPVVLVILDGYGRGPENAVNAIFKAKKPTIDFIEKNFPMTNLQASGIAVGLPWGEEGSSEVGHLNLGAGRIIYQNLPRITFAIRDGSFFKLPALTKLAEHVKKNNSSFHIMGLIGGGNVHSYIDHLYGVLEFAKKENITKVFIHAFTDGRDSPPKDALDFYGKIQNQLNENYPFAKIASLIGRHFAMDRDNHWDRTEKTYQLLTESKGEVFDNAQAAIKSDYDKNITDEFIEPKVLVSEPIKENDAVIFIDFREDSTRQLSRAFVEENFSEFSRKKINNLYFATMTRYEKNLPLNVLFEPIEIKNTLAETVSKSGKNQIHIAETEKYAHVTYFFNGGEEVTFPNEERVLIPTKRDHDFANDPAMSAGEVTGKIIEAIDSKKYDLIVANYANADMVGHTGNFQATVSAVEILDREIGQLMPEVLKTGGVLIITSDHGNADEKINSLTGAPQTEHSANPVPFYLIGNDFKHEKAQEKTEVEKFEVEGILADVAPTVLELFGLPQPSEMTGKSLLKLLAQ